jgi:hypothetical protein
MHLCSEYFSLAPPPCHHCCCHHPPHDNPIPSPSCLHQREFCHPLPQSQQIVSFKGGWWGLKIETPLSKATLRQLLIVFFLLSIVSNVTPAPPSQE